MAHDYAGVDVGALGRHQTVEKLFYIARVDAFGFGCAAHEMAYLCLGCSGNGQQHCCNDCGVAFYHLSVIRMILRLVGYALTGEDS